MEEEEEYQSYQHDALQTSEVEAILVLFNTGF
jgi:hypothetical protein